MRQNVILQLSKKDTNRIKDCPEDYEILFLSGTARYIVVRKEQAVLHSFLCREYRQEKTH